VKELKNYVAFKRIKNFACVEVYPQTKVVAVYLKVDPKAVTLEEGFTRDVSKIGHFSTGDLQVSLRSMEDFARAQRLFVRSYEGS
jgi:predicted transport protein